MSIHHAYDSDPEAYDKITGNYKLKLPLPGKDLANNFDSRLNEPNSFEHGLKSCG